ncbi:MAG: benzoyl-CoA 2,3-epoxidase subunit BoxA [Rhizobiaceae bacterium]
MTTPLKQHLIDPEICIRCYTCENTCPIEAITHNDDNVVVDFAKCNYCMDCIPVCPTGSIDNWRVVEVPYSLDEQFEWMELPEQADFDAGSNEAATGLEAFDEEIVKLLADAHAGGGGKARAPASASKPSINLYSIAKPAEVTVQGNYRLTDDVDHDVRHIILDAGTLPLPLLEGQSIGVIPPGTRENGEAHLPRLYSISSPRDGERPNYNNFSLTVKREEGGICSNYVCDLQQGDKVRICGPFGSTFLMPNEQDARLLMVCTGTGSAPMRAFTMNRQRTSPDANGKLTLVFGARAPKSLPYFGRLEKVPDTFLEKHLVFSRLNGEPKRYVQHELRAMEDQISEMLADPKTHIYICGLRAMEEGVEAAFENIAESTGHSWRALRDTMRDEGRYHVETY